MLKWALLTLWLGIGASLMMDLWTLIQKRVFNTPSISWALVGRWVGHFGTGKFIHSDVSKAAIIPGELSLGWAVHYLTGVLFAVVFVVWVGEEWLLSPTIIPALVFGIATLIFPFLIVQPGMGAGIAASKTPDPSVTRIRSLFIHTMFGIGLFISALVWRLLEG